MSRRQHTPEKGPVFFLNDSFAFLGMTWEHMLNLTIVELINLNYGWWFNYQVKCLFFGSIPGWGCIWFVSAWFVKSQLWSTFEAFVLNLSFIFWWCFLLVAIHSTKFLVWLSSCLKPSNISIVTQGPWCISKLVWCLIKSLDDGLYCIIELGG